MSFRWEFGWYCTKQHAVDLEVAANTNTTAAAKSVCGAYVYPHLPTTGRWSGWQKKQKHKNRGPESLCKHCVRELKKRSTPAHAEGGESESAALPEEASPKLLRQVAL